MSKPNEEIRQGSIGKNEDESLHVELTRNGALVSKVNVRNPADAIAVIEYWVQVGIIDDSYNDGQA